MLWLMLALTATLALWRLYFLHQNQRKARQSLDWITEVIRGHGRITGVRRLNPATFLAGLEVSSPLFCRVKARIRLRPRHDPVAWLWSWHKQEPETLQIAADLHSPPGIELEIHTHCWRTPLPHSIKHEAEFEQVGPFVLTTRSDWKREITSMVTALVSVRDCKFLSVSFSRHSPHFVVTIPLLALSPETGSEFFLVLHELASCGSASCS
jgi:hypothetical protein